MPKVYITKNGSEITKKRSESNKSLNISNDKMWTQILQTENLILNRYREKLHLAYDQQIVRPSSL